MCPYCGRPKNASLFTFDALGGVKAGEDLGNGVTAGEAAEFVKINTARYIPKFLSLKSRKASWNWAAFLFPEGWFLSRKMYLIGAFFAAIGVAAQVCLLPLMLLGNNALGGTYAEYFAEIMSNLSLTGNGPLVVAAIGSVIYLISRIVAGIIGDYIYRNHVIGAVTELREDDDREFKTLKKGGVNLFAFLIGVAATTYLPELIIMLFK